MIELELLTPPGTLIPLAEVKAHLRVDFADDDALIAALVEAAAQHVGGVLAWRSLLAPTEWRATFDAWDGDCIYLPMPTVQSVDLIEIVDESSVPAGVVTIDPANTVLDKDLGRLRFVGAAVNGGGAPGRLRVEYTAGDLTLQPWARSAILLLVGHLYENRETVVIGAGVAAIDVPWSVETLAGAHRAWRPGGAI